MMLSLVIVARSFIWAPSLSFFSFKTVYLLLPALETSRIFLMDIDCLEHVNVRINRQWLNVYLPLVKRLLRNFN